MQSNTVHFILILQILSFFFYNKRLNLNNKKHKNYNIKDWAVLTIQYLLQHISKNLQSLIECKCIIYKTNIHLIFKRAIYLINFLLNF